ERPEATLLLMPAWRSGRFIGVKSVTVFPDNATRGLASVMGVYLLLDGENGMPLAVIDATSLTLRRTAAASALAADYLARRDAKHLLRVGPGALAPHLVGAHATVRALQRVSVWGRNEAKAQALAERLRADGIAADAVNDLARAVERADIVSCATLASAPLV